MMEAGSGRPLFGPALRFAVATFVAALFAVASASAGTRVNVSRGAAIHGYDPVAYFDQGKPVKGSRELTLMWMDVEWRFASEEHRARFRENPEAYAPQFGGYCAWAVSRGSLADGDPKVWRIVDGKLYLNYSRGVHEKWERDIPGNVARAEEQWPGLVD